MNLSASRLLFFVVLLSAPLAAQNPPRITGVFPQSSGLLSPGSFAFLRGSDLGGQSAVTVGGLSAEVYSFSATVINFRVPPGVAIGQSPVVVTTRAGSSAPFSISLIPVSPGIAGIGPGFPIPIPYNFLRQPDCCVPNPFPLPGEVVWLYVNGLGPALPAPAPKLLIDGQDYPVLGTRTGIRGMGGETGATCGPTSPPPFCATQVPVISFKIPDLQPGRYSLWIQAGGVDSPKIPLDLIYSGIITSQSGLTFNAVEGGPAPLAQIFSVLSGTGTIAFNHSTSTTSGGNWLSISPASDSASAGQTGKPVRVSVSPAGLAAGVYYGTIQVSANGVLNSPQSVTIVLKVSPAGTPIGPVLDQSGLIFLGTQSGGNPPTQTITIANPTTVGLTYTSTISLSPQFRYSPATASIGSGQSVNLNLDATLAGAAPGVYTARLTLNFSDQSARIVNLLLVVAPNTPASNAPAPNTPAPNTPAPNTPAKTKAPLDAAPFNAAGCTPTKLLPIFSQPGAGFNVSAAWPTPIVVSVADNCSTPLRTGNVNVTFSNGDPLLPLNSLRDGSWAASWSAFKPVAAGVSITANATDPATGLSGSATLAGAVAANADVPIISRGGVVDLASYGPALAPGSMVAVFGSKLASGSASADSLPLPFSLKDTTLALGGKPVPLIYTSDGQVNALIPYDVPLNASLQLTARKGTALSSPQAVLLVPARPSVFTVDASGSGQGHIYWYDSSGNQTLAGPKSPAKPGDSVVIYCMGLGATDPPVLAGVAAPLTTLSKTVNPVMASIGGRPATVAFAGITPGGTGLYQVNLTVPAGLPDSDTTTVTLSAGGQDSAVVTLAVRTPR